MHALFFEVRPHPGHLPHYFDHVARLKPELTRHRGLVFLDRYTSLADPDVLLSHQLWQDEDAMSAWRQNGVHRASQAAGRHVHFADYRIRVAERVLCRPDPDEAPPLCPVAQTGGTHVVAFYGPQPIRAAGMAAFESVNHPGRFISLGTAEGLADATQMVQARAGSAAVEQAAAYRVVRDYGLRDRAQAPR